MSIVTYATISDEDVSMVMGVLSTWTSTDIVTVVLRSRESRRACVFGNGLLLV
jgi:hypothetical protein